MATMMSSKRIERLEKFVDMCSGSSNSPQNRGRQRNFFGDTIRKDEMTDKNYEDGINDILQNVSHTSAITAMEVMRPENRGKFVTGSKQAFGEIQKYLQG